LVAQALRFARFRPHLLIRFPRQSTSSVALEAPQVFGPKVLLMATSRPSRPRAINTRPMRGILFAHRRITTCRQGRPQNQPAKSIGPIGAACDINQVSRAVRAGISCNGRKAMRDGVINGKAGSPGIPPKLSWCGARVHSKVIAGDIVADRLDTPPIRLVIGPKVCQLSRTGIGLAISLPQ